MFQFENDVLSVKQAISIAQDALDQFVLCVQGEISSMSMSPRYSAVYFTIKDDDDKASLSCLIWKNRYSSLDLNLEEGMLVNLTGRFSIYPKKGNLTFDVYNIEPAGEGTLRLKVANLIKKMQEEGIFEEEHKLPIPQYPERIGVITSGSGAVIHDVISTIKRRCNCIEINFYGVPIEGAKAAFEMIKALEALDACELDAILLVRGGGSFEDMMPFNEEALVRTIYSVKTPVITGIGHRPDNTISDLVSDYCAATPTAAAEKITEGLFDLKAKINPTRERLQSLITKSINEQIRIQNELKLRLTSLSPTRVLEHHRIRFDNDLNRLMLAVNNSHKSFEVRVKSAAKRLDDLSPLSAFTRGYSCVFDEDGNVVSHVSDVILGSLVNIELIDGSLNCEVKGISSNSLFDSNQKENNGNIIQN